MQNIKPMGNSSDWMRSLNKPINVTSFMQLSIPPMDWIVEGMFGASQVGYLYSGTGKGKSLNAMLLNYAIATGKPFGRYKVVKPRKVLYLDGEMHPIEFQNRLRRLNPTDKDYEKFINNFFYWNGLYGDGFPDLSDKESYKEFFLFCTEHEIDVVTIDNYFAMTRMKNYNDPQEVQKLEDNFVKVAKQWGIAILFIDHTNKSGNDYGTVTKLGFAEFALKISYDQESKMFTMSRTKGRSFNMDFEDMVYRISQEDNSIQVLDIESAKSDVEAKQVEKNLVGNEFKKIYTEDRSRSDVLREAMKNYGETKLSFETFRTCIPTWIADMGYESDISNNQ